MIILKDKREAGRVDEKEKKIITRSQRLRSLVQAYIDKGIIAGLKGWYDKKLKVHIDTADRVFPKDGKRFWTALGEDLILEGYDLGKGS